MTERLSRSRTSRERRAGTALRIAIAIAVTVLCLAGLAALGDANDWVRHLAGLGPGALALSLGLCALISACRAARVAAGLGTIARVVVQVTNALSNPLWPELTALKGQQGDGPFWLLYRRAKRLGLLIATAGALLVFLAAPWLLEVWTHGQTPFAATPMAPSPLYAATCSATQVPRVVLMSIDRHAGLAAQSLLADTSCHLRKVKQISSSA